MKIFSLGSLLLIGITAFAGCTREPATTVQSEPTNAPEAAPVHNLHDKPLTETEIEALKNDLTNYEVAVAKVESFRDKIREAIAAGNPLEAHRPLDELDIVLEYLPVVARENDIPKSQWEKVNTSAQAIRELFNQVHAQIDAGEEPDYEAVAKDIDREIEKLESAQVANRIDRDEGSL